MEVTSPLVPLSFMFFPQMMGYVCVVALIIVVLLVLLRGYAQWVRYRQQPPKQRHQRRRVMAFYHPYCAGGGGGERVLWKAIEVLGTMVAEQKQPTSSSAIVVVIIIFTIDPPSSTYATDVLQQVQERFSITLPNQSNNNNNNPQFQIRFVHLHDHQHLLQPAPYLSLLVESWNTLRLAWYGLQKCRQQGYAPHIFIDTTGAAFTFVPAVILYACRVIAYVHYPTISTDMLQRVWDKRRTSTTTTTTTKNNNNNNHAAAPQNSRRTSTTLQTSIKVIYYCMYAILYGMVGSLASLVMVNSTWTLHHIEFLWKVPAWRKLIHIVYPPCAVSDLLLVPPSSSQSSTIVQSPPKSKSKHQTIISIGQFRPEKDHELQIEAMALLLEQHPELKPYVTLKLMGSCRHNNVKDQLRLQQLQQLVNDKLQLQSNIQFMVNVPYHTLKSCFQKEASVGIHTMWNEHFGIGIVEMMAAGIVVVAHNSGGPRTDIITHGVTGYLATTVEEYAQALYTALTLPPSSALRMRTAAQQSSLRFSDEVFATTFRNKVLQAKVLL
jgi:alpha-1,2-mannosyltransferase